MKGTGPNLHDLDLWTCCGNGTKARADLRNYCGFLVLERGNANLLKVQVSNAKFGRLFGNLKSFLEKEHK